MTDTTDTGGKMYSLAINAPQPLNITFTDGSQLIFPLSGKASFTGDVEESARVFFDAVIRHRDSQLEAERQRADRYHFVAMSALETQAEISEQLGINEDECDGSPEQVHEKIEMLQKEISALKAKLANPVVLPNRRDSDPAILTYTDAIKAINAAGFTVKEE